VSDPAGSPSARLDHLLAHLGTAPAPGVSAVLTGRDPVLSTPFPIGELTAAALGAVGVAAANLWYDRTGVGQRVSVDATTAAAAIHGRRLQRLDGRAVDSVPCRPIVGPYRCADDRFIELCAPFPHLLEGTLSVLGCVHEDRAVAAAVGRWRSPDLEQALAHAGQCGVVVRSPSEWAEHEQSRAVAPLGPVSVEKIGKSVPMPLELGGTSPLDGVRVLDLTRVVAGPQHGRLLADLGADVLLVNSPFLINVLDSLIDTGHGKCSALLDLDDARDEATLRRLVADADVFVDGYRGGSLERRGFGPEALAAMRPGIVAVSINCYGDVGPWRSRPGFEPIAQSAAGIAYQLAVDGVPGLLPGTVCDYVTGCLAALGTLVALRRRAREGGSYLVRASLVQTAMWISRIGAVVDDLAGSGFGDLSGRTVRSLTAFGVLDHLVPPIELSATPLRWRRTAVPPGTDPPAWPRPLATASLRWYGTGDHRANGGSR
jgi:crotonobetainyl-CoA:carnitine CoA-transferase CaiB-like acyl-CoA transferase